MSDFVDTSHGTVLTSNVALKISEKSARRRKKKEIEKGRAEEEIFCLRKRDGSNREKKKEKVRDDCVNGKVTPDTMWYLSGVLPR